MEELGSTLTSVALVQIAATVMAGTPLFALAGQGNIARDLQRNGAVHLALRDSPIENHDFVRPVVTTDTPSQWVSAQVGGLRSVMTQGRAINEGGLIEVAVRRTNDEQLDLWVRVTLDGQHNRRMSHLEVIGLLNQAGNARIRVDNFSSVSKLRQPWGSRGGDVYAASFELSEETLARMERGNLFAFDLGMPNSLRDIDPAVILHLAGFAAAAGADGQGNSARNDGKWVSILSYILTGHRDKGWAIVDWLLGSLLSLLALVLVFVLLWKGVKILRKSQFGFVSDEQRTVADAKAREKELRDDKRQIDSFVRAKHSRIVNVFRDFARAKRLKSDIQFRQHGSTQYWWIGPAVPRSDDDTPLVLCATFDRIRRWSFSLYSYSDAKQLRDVLQKELRDGMTNYFEEISCIEHRGIRSDRFWPPERLRSTFENAAK